MFLFILHILYCAYAIHIYVYSARFFVENVRRFLDGQPLQSIVDLTRGY